MGFEARCHEIGELLWLVQTVQVVRRLATAPRGCMDWRWRGDLMFWMRRVRSSRRAENSDLRVERHAALGRWMERRACIRSWICCCRARGALPTCPPLVKFVKTVGGCGAGVSCGHRGGVSWQTGGFAKHELSVCLCYPVGVVRRWSDVFVCHC